MEMLMGDTSRKFSVKLVHCVNNNIDSINVRIQFCEKYRWIEVERKGRGGWFGRCFKNRLSNRVK